MHDILDMMPEGESLVHAQDKTKSYSDFIYRNQAEQSKDHPAAPVGGLPLLEGQHPLEGAGAADAHREHDPALRQDEGRLVDQHGALQPGEDTQVHLNSREEFDWQFD